jgi:trehalose synthase
MVPLLRELGVDTTWDVIKGDEAFFAVTKTFHNALHGQRETLSEEMFDIYQENTRRNLEEVDLSGDVVLVHDPQPAGLVTARQDRQRWIWRCHIDVSSPDRWVWGFLRPLIDRYDAAIFSMPEFAQVLGIPQFLVAPSIDPFAPKNRDLDDDTIGKVLALHQIDPARPILTQISRFDRLKDPLGVIAAYRMVKHRQDCQLVLAGGGASDDPEGMIVLQEVREAAEGDPDIHVILLPPYSDTEINALVRASTIVVQKSLREGFGLTVAEALWKRKPVVAGAVGGIKIQVIDDLTGYLVHSPEGAAHRILQLLRDPERRRIMGENGYEHVRRNFLLTRHIKDYLLMMLAVDHLGEHVVSLDA